MINMSASGLGNQARCYSHDYMTVSIHIYLAHHDAFHVARHDRAFEPPNLRQPGVNRDICRQCYNTVVATRTFLYQPPTTRTGL